MGIFVTLVLYCVFVALQALFFRTEQRSWGQALDCWQGLYVVWFVLAVAIVERAHRWRWLQALRRSPGPADSAN